MLPNFFHVGFPKAASKSLQLILKQHPDIFIPDLKEQNFFNNDNKYIKGLKWYEKTFYSKTGSAKMIGDLSVGYSNGLAIEVPERIFNNLGPDVKIIFILRHPVDRAYSNYCMARYKGQFEDLDFKTAIENALSVRGKYDLKDIKRVQDGSYYSNIKDMNIYRDLVYIETGMYYKIILRYLKFYKLENVLFISFDELINNIQQEADKIFDFLHVKRIAVDFIKANESTGLNYPRLKIALNKIYKYSFIRFLLNNVIPIKARAVIKKGILGGNYVMHKYPKIDIDTAAILQDIYNDDIIKLKDLTMQDYTCWINKYKKQSI